MVQKLYIVKLYVVWVGIYIYSMFGDGSSFWPWFFLYSTDHLSLIDHVYCGLRLIFTQ